MHDHSYNSSGEGFLAGMSMMMMMLVIGAVALVLVVGALLWRPWGSSSTGNYNNPSQQQQVPSQQNQPIQQQQEQSQPNHPNQPTLPR
jgi:hypothetical protein